MNNEKLFSHPPRVLGLISLTALVTGNMIGSGIFLLPATLAQIGSISLVSWIITAIGALLLATIFARLGFLLPQTGGAYTFCRHAFGKFIAFQVAFCYWVQSWVGNVGMALAFVGYMSIFLPTMNDTAIHTFISAAAAVWFLTGVNLLGIREASWLQVLTTVLKLLPLFLIIGAGIWSIQIDHFTAFNVSGKSNFQALKDAATLTLWSFVGLEAATIPAGVVKDPQRNIPRATIYGTLIVAIVYILSTIVVFGQVPLKELAESNAPYAAAAKVLFGDNTFKLIALGGAISAFGALNGWIMLQAQVPLAAARDDLFPKIFMYINRHGSPIWGLIISSLLITTLLALNLNRSLVNQFTFAIALATLSSLIPYIFTTMAYFIIQRQNNELTGSRKIFYCTAALFGFIYSYFAISGSDEESLYFGMMLFLSSLPIYAWLNWHHEFRLQGAQT